MLKLKWHIPLATTRGEGVLHHIARRHPWWIAIGGFIGAFVAISSACGAVGADHFAAGTLAATEPDSFFGNLLKVYMPRHSCMFEETSLIWLHVVCDAVIAIAYYSIPVALVYFVIKRKDLAFNWMFVCFAVFILACGAGHVLSVLAIWHPIYRLEGIVKAITAIASVGTAIILWPLIPKALQLPSPRELQVANKELESFSYSVSHDLCAPLRHMDGLSCAVLEDYADKLDDEGKDHLNRIRAASQRMGQLIDDLLNLSKVTRSTMKRQKTDLSKLANEIADELRATAPDRDVDFAIQSGLIANVDPSLVRIALYNLLGNAWKFTANTPKPRIEFGHSGPPSSNAYVVRDNGAGFDMEYSGKLFGAFQRMHTSNEFPGTGIGLATVQRIVHRHGGKIRAEAKVGAGAAFYFNL